MQKLHTSDSTQTQSNIYVEEKKGQLQNNMIEHNYQRLYKQVLLAAINDKGNVINGDTALSNVCGKNHLDEMSDLKSTNNKQMSKEHTSE